MIRLFGWVVRKLGGPGPTLVWCQIAIVVIAVFVLILQGVALFGGES